MKLTHVEVAYEHPAKGMHHCSQCEHYVPDDPPDSEPHCRIVRDPIRAGDWCKRWEKR